MNNSIFEKTKKIISLIFFIILFLIFMFLLYKTKDNKLIDNVKDFIEKDTKILYITNKSNYSNYPINMLKKYEIEYMYINSDNLSSIEKTKLEKIANSKHLESIIVIFENGKVKDAIIQYENEEKLNEFLIENEVLPEVLGDTSNIISSVEEIIDTDISILYLPYKNIKNIDAQDKILKNISNIYDINYQKVDAYLLSKPQQNKLNTLLQISKVEDQIIILIKNKKIIGSIRGINTKRKYINEMKKYNFINKTDDYINYINYNEFKNLINNDQKSIISIGKDECKYCSELIEIFNDIIEENDISIYYLNIKNLESEEALQVQEILKKLKYNDGFTTPLTLLVENNNLIDYVIGSSSEEFFVDKFRENGIIKNEV